MTAGPILSLRHYRDSLIAHSHEHPQLVFGLRGRLEFEVQGQGAGIDRQGLVVVPAGAHHTCASDAGSHCLVLDVPGEQWLHEQLGEHADASCRLLDRPAALGLDNRQQQLVDWLAASPMDDPLIARQGAALLLASLTQRRQPTCAPASACLMPRSMRTSSNMLPTHCRWPTWRGWPGCPVPGCTRVLSRNAG